MLNPEYMFGGGASKPRGLSRVICARCVQSIPVCGMRAVL